MKRYVPLERVVNLIASVIRVWFVFKLGLVRDWLVNIAAMDAWEVVLFVSVSILFGMGALNLWRQWQEFKKFRQWVLWHSPNYGQQQFSSLEAKINYLIATQQGKDK